MSGEIRIGSIVKSTAGRDKDGYFMVVSIINDEYVELVDGKLRRLGNEKTKKLKHIKTTGIALDDIAARIIDSARISDKEINTAIKNSINKSEVSNV